MYGVNGYRRDLRGPRPELIGNLNAVLEAKHRACYAWLVHLVVLIVVGYMMIFVCNSMIPVLGMLLIKLV